MRTLARSTSAGRFASVAALAACALALSGCVTVNVPPKESGGGSGASDGSKPSTSSPGSSHGSSQQHGDDDYPKDGIPTSVMWPSDWLEGFMSESAGVRGTIVAIDLDYDRGEWLWEVTSRDPGDGKEFPTRGFEAKLAADTLEVLSDREVQLDADDLADTKVGIAEAARLSGEKSPSPRLIELSLDEERGVPVWGATIVDTETRAETDLTIDANSGEILKTEAD